MQCNNNPYLNHYAAGLNYRSKECKSIIQQALKNANFKFHRTSSLSILEEDNSLAEQIILSRFKGDSERSTNKCKPRRRTLLMATNKPNGQNEMEADTEQQIEHSGSLPPATRSGGEVGRPHLPPAGLPGRPLSILGSVCALLLAKQASSPKLASSSSICRICFGGSSGARLVRPCACRGTVAAVHRACLERWLLAAATSHCELCRHHYVVTRRHNDRPPPDLHQKLRRATRSVGGQDPLWVASSKYISRWSLWRSLWEWCVSGRGRALAADATRGVLLGAASVLGTARVLRAADALLHAAAAKGGPAALAANVFSSVLIGIIGALNGLLTTWMLLKVQEHQASWRAWRDSTVLVRVTLDDPTPPAATPSTASFSTVSPADLTERATSIVDPLPVPNDPPSI